MPKLPDATDLGVRPTPESRRGIATVRNAGAVGSAIEDVGRAGFRAGQELAELRQRQDAARAGRDFAELAGEIERETNARRERAEPGGAGHTQLVESETDRRTGEFLASIRDRRVRDNFATQVAQLRARVVAGEDAWEIGQRRELAVANVEEATGLLENNLRTNPNAEAYQNFLDATRSTILGGGLTGNIAEAQIRARQRRLTRAYLQGLKEQNPTAAQEILRRGVLNQYLDADDQEPLIQSVDAEIRVREAEARRELAAARAQATQEINLFQRRLNDGDPTITDDDLNRVQQLAQTAQLPLEVYDTARARIIYETNREYRTATAPEVQQALNTVEARLAQQGENASPDDVVRRDRLQTILTQRQQRDANNPLGSMAARGVQIAPINFQDQGSLRNRAAAARAAEQQIGHYSYFQPAEVSLLQERLSAGPQGRMEVINDLAAIAAVDAQAALRAARQIAPNDAALRHALRVGPQARALVARGAEARGLLPTSMETEDGTTQSFNTITQNWFSAHIVPSLNRLEPDFSAGTLEAARAIYAERLRQMGRSGQTEFDGGLFASSVDIALSRTANGRGGMGRWSYGPRAEDGDWPGVLLPSNMNQAEFTRSFTGLPIARLGEEWPQGSVNGTPVWSNGQPVSVDDIRGRFVPVAVRDGVYEFRGNGQVLMTRGGQPFQIDIRRIPPRRIAPAQQTPTPPQTPVRPALPPRRSQGTRGPVYIPVPNR